MNIKKPIFIAGIHKSGTSLLRSLLDGHPDLFVIPFESHYFQLSGHWVDNEYQFKLPNKYNQSQIINAFVSLINFYNTSENYLGDADLREKISIEDFKQYFIDNYFKFDKESEKISVYFNAIHMSLFKKPIPTNIRVVEKSVENAEFALELYHYFPDAKFIHIIRNPYSNIVSLRKAKSVKHNYPLINRIIRTFYNNYYFLYKNKKIIKNYYVLKYEDLILEPKTHIQKICKFLEIEYHPILERPTQLGEIWYGNSTTGKKFFNISSENLNTWENEIHPMEIFYINKLFYFVFNDFNYKKIEPKSSYLKYIKGEGIKRYIYNRLYNLFLRFYDSF